MKLIVQAMIYATGEIGIAEGPVRDPKTGKMVKLPNRGEKVDLYLRSIGFRPEKGSYPWCAAFVHWCFDEAARELKVANPCPKVGGALAMYTKAKHGKTLTSKIDPERIKPGMVFVMKRGKTGSGHCGIVTERWLDEKKGWWVETIEGNTNAAGSREGNCVARQVRPIKSIYGFVDHSWIQDDLTA